jgi:Ca2+-binding RTX toxin-like protein
MLRMLLIKGRCESDLSTPLTPPPYHRKAGLFMRHTVLLLATMVLTLLLASGVALAANISCLGGPCVGTAENDQITGSQVDDKIRALGGRDDVTARGGDDLVYGGRGRDDISGGHGGDGLLGGGGPDDIDGGLGTTDASEPPNDFYCTIDGVFSTQGTQPMFGDDFGLMPPGERDGNDDLHGSRDGELLVGGGGRNDLSGGGGGDCLFLWGAENEQASAGAGDDIIFAWPVDTTGDDISCGVGDDFVLAGLEDRVAADCEYVELVEYHALRATSAASVSEVTITTPEGTITMTP